MKTNETVFDFSPVYRKSIYQTGWNLKITKSVETSTFDAVKNDVGYTGVGDSFSARIKKLKINRCKNWGNIGSTIKFRFSTTYKSGRMSSERKHKRR